ncbi:MAG: VOC family protein [Deltaproteobacteria bacterium]|nr:VOC family protein [Deltaproteobacteria bacterium]
MANPFCFIELNTDLVDPAKKFYAALFSWKMNDIKMGPMTYTMLDIKNPGGGIGKKPMPDAPTMWLPYVEVADVKVAVAKAKKLGAKVIVDFQPLPDMGAIGVLIDPTGAAFGVWAPDKKAAAKKPAKKAAKKPAAKKPAAKKPAKTVAKKVAAKKPAKKAKK